MKRTFSCYFLSLLFLLPAVASWAQSTEFNGDPLTKLKEKSAQGTEAQAPQSQTTSETDSSSVKSVDPWAGLRNRGPMFPDSLMKGYEVEVFQNVLKMAEWASFKYMEVLEQAKKGDVNAIYKMLDFHRYVDGKDALNHGVTCLELLPLAGDEAYAKAVSMCKLKLREVVKERLMLAQGRTKKGFLQQQPIETWAPWTWNHLNEKEPPLPEKVVEKPKTETPSAAPNAGSSSTPAPKDVSSQKKQ